MVREERKVVTILFTDLVGSTALAEGRDPEDVRAILAPYYAQLRAQIEQRGGTVEKFIGDAVMAVFGAPVAHEDDPIRAVLAALAIRDTVGDDLQIRTAVHTGEALVALDADPGAGDAFVSGDVVNTAARLQSSAPVNGILVGEATWRATRHVIDYRDADPVDAKGKSQPVPVWEVVAARSRLGTDVEMVHATEIVGRERELFLLEDALARCQREQTAQLVTLVGVPGIGKSRIVAELLGRLDASPELYWWRQGRSLPYGETRSAWALGEIVKAQAGILETDDVETVQGKVEAMLAELLPDPEERRWVGENVHVLAGAGGRVDESSDRRVEAFSAWRRLFEALAERRPLVLVFEDLHWADDTLLDFVDYLAEWVSGVPVLIVATARPELLDRRPDWGGGKRNATALSIAPLSEEETARLLAAVLDRRVLDAERQQAVLRRAEGNPLYAAEYARMLADHEGGELPLPETVQGVIAARIDGLPPAEKALLQDAAVLGKVFWPGALDGATDDLLHGLERREFVRRDRRSAVAGETQYAFLHLLVRDVAYGQIPRARRMKLHRAAAAWIESLSPDRSEDRAEMLAHHYREALRLAEASGADPQAFREPALRALIDASERAAALGSWGSAAELATEALDLTADGDPSRPGLQLRLARGKAFGAEAAIDIPLAESARDGFVAHGDRAGAAEAEAFLAWATWWTGDGERARAHSAASLELARDLPLSYAKAFAYARAARLEGIGGDPARAVGLADETLAMAEELDSDELRSDALNSRGISKAKLGDDRFGIDDLRRAVELADASKSVQQMATARNNLASNLAGFGRVRESMVACREARDIGLRFGSRAAAVWPAMQLVQNKMIHGDPTALTDAEELLREVDPSSQVHVGLLTAKGNLLAMLGRFAEAAPLVEEGLVGARLARDMQAIVPALGAKLTLHILTGQIAEANAVADEFVATPAYLEPSFLGEISLQLVELGRESDWLAVSDGLRRTPWAEAGAAAARGDLARAADLYDEIGALVSAAWARLLAAERGDFAQLERARAFFADRGAAPFVARCIAVPAASA
ncbi:MAG: AAA family ATPase [Actinobacteria bacterium]|nr:AAA family ATPase [Actinomycetota bacterium]